MPKFLHIKKFHMLLIHHEDMKKFTKIDLFTRKISQMRKKMDNFTIFPPLIVKGIRNMIGIYSLFPLELGHLPEE